MTKIFESFSEFYTKRINEDHILPGTKVKLPNGDIGTLQSWSDETEKYIVMNAAGDTEEFADDEISIAEAVNEDHITPGTQVTLKSGKLVTVQNWSDSDGMYTGLVDGSDEQIKFTDEEIKE